MDCSTPGLPVHHQLSELPQTQVHQVNDAIQSSHSLSSPSSPTFNLSQHQGLLQWVSSLHQLAKHWSFSFNISPYNEYSRLIAFSIDWFDLLAVQETQESSPAPQFKSINSLMLRFLYWRRKWQPTPVFLPGKSHGHRSLVLQRVGHDCATSL